MKGNVYGVPLERSDYLKLAPHPDSCTPETFQEWLEGFGKGKRLAIDLFSGAGGLSAGVERAGWTTAAAVDFDERALETHRANFPGLSLHMDLGDPDERDRLVELLTAADIDLVAGGPPCQPFSRAGRNKIRDLVKNHGRDPEDRRKELWSAYLDIVTRVRPRVVLMENVPDMGLHDDFFVIRAIEEKLEELGYATQVRLVDAWNYGVPQHRKRLILLARRDVAEFDWRAPDADPTTLRDAIGDLPELEVVPTERVGEREMAYRKPRALPSFAEMMRVGAPRGRVWDHMTRRVREDDHYLFSLMESKTKYSDLGKMLKTEKEKKYQRYADDKYTDKYKKLDWDQLSRTITAHIAKDGYWYIHPEQLRTLTVREAARVQTFPDRFRFAGTRSDAFRQIGNAVPPLLGEAAAEALRPVDGAATDDGGLQPHWRRVRGELTEWARRRREGRDWYQLPREPGDGEVSLHAAIVAVVSGAKIKPAAMAEMMEIVRPKKKLTASLLVRLIEAAPTAAARTRLDRLTPLVGKPSVWRWHSRLDLPGLLSMKPSEKSLYHLLIGEDLMLVGQGTLRVAARMNSLDTDHANRLSEGRVNLVKLVGAGQDAPLRMGAIRLIGSDLCRDAGPVCSECPLLLHCPRRKARPDDLLTLAASEE
ncbi:MULTISPECIES: DNA cytosine methyltransferase [unclassified Streptomyces]|uniref:DNA cytosine methyltransferase n=1 Tax=unclassified Streptomyces TaxID=2593676 RepID=UPI002ECFCE09|nr:DNA cytosine methyltransferase [Streptomyces sp. NBC_00891]WSY06251.1 DNA cytosine methyltransferase [Streptomyces sp. NBC_00890]WSZ07876.1 DNA cytosine methyltransferase [Streptomyces sp. NBC_00869]WSZ24625.1 DNA cytosine methyltransferase [Streptomyces sp. NBC_00870]